MPDLDGIVSFDFEIELNCTFYHSVPSYVLSRLGEWIRRKRKESDVQMSLPKEAILIYATRTLMSLCTVLVGKRASFCMLYLMR